jgi:Membrane protein involved in colicin uptake
MNKTKIISALLIFVMLFGTVANLSILPVFAAGTTDTTDTTKDGEDDTTETIDYTTTVYASQEEKLATMVLSAKYGDYELYYQDYTGEIAVKNIKTNTILFSNPYDVASPMAGGAISSTNVANQILSQLIIKYTDNDSEVPMYSYVESALRGQITKKNLKNGIRVEYILGRQETRKLVPKMIEKSRFEELILANITDPAKLKKINAFYTLKDPDDPTLTERAKQELQSTFPITTKMAVYVFDPYASERELNLIESIIREFCPNYTYETLQEDHLMTEYTGTDTDPALFRMSLEYYLDDYGLSVRLPANGIKFNESTYSLTYIRILPYMGAGSSDFTGYTFIPDGSGTLVRFEDIVKQGTARTISGQLYGQDYAYHEISGAHQQVMRLPIYGVVEDYKGEVKTQQETTVTSYIDEYGIEQQYDTPQTEVTDVTTEVSETRGYVAIIEEGDALAKIVTDHGGNVLHKYNSVFTEFYPRPKDSYNLAESISVGANATWTVVSERKYTGSYRIRYIMLTDDDVAAKAGVTDYYTASYVGMAKAYQDYLVREGVITKLSDSGKETGDDIPLYIEALGVIDTQEKVLSIPVIVKTPLTTFDDLKQIYSDLSAEGINNINFRLTGFTNGGLYCTTPFKVKFEKVVGGNSGYEDFLTYAKENNIGVYPDFDYSYAAEDKWFDGFSYRKDAVKTIDSRYTQKRLYSASFQYFTRTGLVAISPSVFEDIFNSFSAAIDKIGGATGISVSTLGSDLNSDFDKKEPYNREDTKGFVIDTLEKLYNKYGDIMVDGGNAYTLRYVSHVLNVALDSSRYTYASEAVPMFGLVFHGYLDFAGTPTNMAGDLNYETLKIIENGAAPYFVLVYQNTAELKESGYSEYYSVSYQIWRDDLIAKYKELNTALSSVKYATIVNHEFLIGERVPYDYEIAADDAAAKAAADAKAKQEADDAAKKEKADKLAERQAAESAQSGETTTETAAETSAETAAAETTAESTTETTAAETTGSGSATGATTEEGTAGEDGYTYTKYTSDNGLIVKVTYSNGDSFILNYNSFAVTVEGYTIPAISYIKIEG